MVFSGYDAAFSKAAFSNPANPANQDMLTSNVKITRGNTKGIFNAAAESSFVDTSPAGTEWAFPHNNPGKSLSAANWVNLTFDHWEVAFGDFVAGGPPATVGQDAVLHLVSEDIYLDIRFTGWGMGAAAGGAFSYVRSSLNAVPEASGTALAMVMVLGLALQRIRSFQWLTLISILIDRVRKGPGRLRAVLP